MSFISTIRASVENDTETFPELKKTKKTKTNAREYQ